MVYHLLKLGKHTLSGSNLHIYLGNQQTASNVWSRHSYSKGLCTGITLFSHIMSLKSSPRPSPTLHCRLWPLLQFTTPTPNSASGFCYTTSIFSTAPHLTLSSASFCVMISEGFAAIQTFCRNSTQTIFS